MQTLKTVCKFVKNYHELIEYFNNQQYETKNLLFPTEEKAMMLYQDKEMHWGSNQTNVVVAAFVTSQARLKLYCEMKLLDERVLYVDTDSIFYKRNLDIYTPNLGDFLCEFTNEIDP